ncbi:putative addiction module antidote protein [Methylobacterium sp. PvP062]|uniref:Addiction module antidote protein n=1 Tax=Methylobacterium radiotolerans TaxID=31998 RepID=A0ABV2NPZ3_9HYPH|nr:MULTISPECIES: addiction module antidote protein [unclassified Methylobacterium]MBP2494734.1 putative addiction module antidote protein [Methylobacterium sp. PvP105]MBP2505395.1 putative addiction module antidote protein [Methylobacterium sp. PvP109]
MSDHLPEYDTAEFLDTPEHVAAYIEAVLEDSDPSLIAHAIGVVARARGMSQIAAETGKSRESLYRALSEKGNPNLDTLTSVLKTIGLRLSVLPIKAIKDPQIKQVVAQYTNSSFAGPVFIKELSPGEAKKVFMLHDRTINYINNEQCVA